MQPGSSEQVREQHETEPSQLCHAILAEIEASSIAASEGAADEALRRELLSDVSL